MMTAARDVLDFWFGGDDAAGPEGTFQRWFGGGEAFDAEIRDRFGALTETALGGGLVEWEEDIRARLALVLVLDQFPRNIFRRTARAFAGDARALRLAGRSVAGGEDMQLSPLERSFLYMPFQHAEDIEAQREGVRLFAALANENAPEPVRKMLRSNLDYARRHHDIVARFGRFPYRNAVLGRETTEAEARWLEESGDRFGQ